MFQTVHCRQQMSREQCLAYIAHFIEDLSPSTSKYEWRQYLKKSSVLGDDLFAADDEAIKKLARHLYRSYVLSAFSRHRSFIVASKLTDKQIEEYLEAVLALDKKYKVDYNTISSNVDLKSVDSAIKKVEFARYKSVLAKLDPKNSPTTIKATAAAERAKAKAAREKKTSASRTSAKKTAKPTTKSSSKSSAKPKAKASCDSYSVAELKEMAREKGLSGYSKLNKADLCKLLKLK